MKVIRKDKKRLESIEDIINYIKSTPDRLPNFYFYGPTGCGKTRAAHEIAKALNGKVYNKSKNHYWRRYDGEKVILIDDIRSNETRYFQGKINTWADPYTTDVMIDGTREWISTEKGDLCREHDVQRITIDPSEYVLILTSVKKPEFVFKFEPEDEAKFDRLFIVMEITLDMFEPKEKRKSKQLE